jgi:hypothetical protein
MYLDPWMIVVLILAFGICSLISRRQGVYFGVVNTLRGLHEQKIIKIDTNGIVSPYKTLETVKKRKRKDAKF